MKNIPRSLLGFKLIAALAMASAGVTSLQAQILRSYTGADTTNWSSTGSWAGAVVPLTNDDVSFRNSATGTNTFNLAIGFTIRNLGVASRTLDSNAAANNVTTTLDLNSRTLNATNLTVGETNGTGSLTGNFTVGSGTLNLAGGSIQVGVRSSNNSIGATGTVTGTSSLNFNATGMTSLRVGVGTGQNGGATGTMDFTNINQGNLSVVGGGDTVYIGARLGALTGTVSTGTVILGTNWDSTAFGTSGNRAGVYVGSRLVNNAGNGTFTQSGGTFTAHSTNFFVGSSSNTTESTALNGTVNLSGTSSALIDATDLWVGSSGLTTAVVTGSLTLGSGGQIVAGTTVVGRSGSSSLTTQASLALDKASLTVVGATGTLLINNRGQVDATVGLTAGGINRGGLIIENTAASALTINSLTTDSRGLQFTFENFNTSLWEVGNAGNFEAIYYAIRWQGINRTAALNTLITDLKLSADTSAISGSPTAQVFFQGGDTYYGFYVNSIPEPSTYAMVALGLGALYLLRRKKNSGKPS